MCCQQTYRYTWYRRRELFYNIYQLTPDGEQWHEQAAHESGRWYERPAPPSGLELRSCRERAAELRAAGILDNQEFEDLSDTLAERWVAAIGPFPDCVDNVLKAVRLRAISSRDLPQDTKAEWIAHVRSGESLKRALHSWLWKSHHIIQAVNADADAEQVA